MRTATATLVAGCLALVAGCGAAGSAAVPGTPVSATEVAATVAPRDEPSPAKPRPVKPTGDAVNTRKVRFTEATPVSKGRKVRLTWMSGVAPCTVLDRVKVKETKKRVTITLYEGTSPKAKNVSCIMIAVEKSTTVKLKSPIGKRKIVDGSA